MSDDPWTSARERTKREVAVAFAPRFRTCPQCGKEELTASRTCPHCGASYTVVARKRRIGARRALAAVAAAMLLALVVVVVIGPAVDEDKRQSAEAERQRLEQSRAQAGELRGPILGVRCGPYPRSAGAAGVETRLDERVGRYECLAATTRIRPTESNPAGSIGHPYLARVDFGSFRYAFCKVSPPPGEKAVPRPGAPGVPAACSAP